MRKVLHHYQVHGVKLTAKKYEMFKDKVKFLGKIVSKDSYCMDPAEVAPVQAFKDCKPETVGDLRKILGLLSYYGPYILNFSHIAKALYSLLSTEKIPSSMVQKLSSSKGKGKHKKSDQLPSSQPITWTEQHQEVLHQLLEHLLRHHFWVTSILRSHLYCIAMPLRRDSVPYCTRGNKASWWSLVMGQEH